MRWGVLVLIAIAAVKSARRLDDGESGEGGRAGGGYTFHLKAFTLKWRAAILEAAGRIIAQVYRAVLPFHLLSTRKGRYACFYHIPTHTANRLFTYTRAHTLL